MSYYPLSQITSNLYTNGNEFSLVPNDESTGYIGSYWTNSRNLSYTGKTPQDTPTQRLYPIISQLSGNSTGSFNLTQQFLTVNIPTIFFPDDTTGAPKYLLGETAYVNNLAYSTIKNVDMNQIIVAPTYSPTIPTEKDYQIGEYRRYFCKKTNEIIYIEINKDIYDKLVNKDPSILYQLYQPFNLPWQLTGDKYQVFITNENITELTSKQQNLPMLSEYLRYEFNKYTSNNYE